MKKVENRIGLGMDRMAADPGHKDGSTHKSRKAFWNRLCAWTVESL